MSTGRTFGARRLQPSVSRSAKALAERQRAAVLGSLG
jgi:hypothetical protein